MTAILCTAETAIDFLRLYPSAVSLAVLLIDISWSFTNGMHVSLRRCCRCEYQSRLCSFRLDGPAQKLGALGNFQLEPVIRRYSSAVPLELLLSVQRRAWSGNSAREAGMADDTRDVTLLLMLSII